MRKSLIPVILQAALFGIVLTIADFSFGVFMILVVMNAVFITWYGDCMVNEWTGRNK